ncbi:MAG TPA: hypothetical protein DD803_10620 [Alcaligenes faecalis]|nr:hypothetical protein [Alcaligenes faecalis]
MGFFYWSKCMPLYKFEQINGDKRFDYGHHGMSAVAVMAAIVGAAIPGPPTCLHAYMPTARVEQP